MRIGPHITILARRQGLLDEVRNETLAARRDINQEVNAVLLDLGNLTEVQTDFSKSLTP